MKNKGAWTKIEYGNPFKSVAKVLGRDSEGGYGLKLFYKEPLEEGQSLEDYSWGGDWGFPLLDCTRMQNIAWRYNLAPRVYDVGVYKNMPYQFVDYVEGREGFGSIEQVMEALRPFGAVLHKEIPKVESKQFVEGKMVDFQIVGIDPVEYTKSLRTLLQEKVYGFMYQSVPELGLFAHRDTDVRIKDFFLDDRLFVGKDVLDIGCSNGMFCNFVKTKGAKRVVGLDFPELADAAFHLSNYYCHFNIDYVGTDLKTETYETLSKKVWVDKFDYLFLLSMTAHIGAPAWIYEFVKDEGTVFFEKSGGNIGEDRERDVRDFINKFSNVRRLPNTSDQDREAYVLTK